ncbi:autotransporter outer membrane beta-barrel domain-containing protein [Stenotrophomonas maltophilia]|uniref:autotransporter family protein n=1 Tax=Stenotrophomonas TaxID=40323 RepID=UPI00065829CB|nr:autotransporter outer membrane beta-barrel domain-containing protein [Stenotrophomonas maltophilia]CRR66994.1 Outer membrane protein IcsA autotransporter precursor [Pseudomonas aeruginosa]MBA0227990.1 autotransporter outer membrane beta-barrel domain-containing protein [Stenotrophomonas maltophilia]MBA0367292.1 autotransporter outer membrane beta-barrel domain-containing protein [Stenotrophomonas maltophilia]MBA0405274.1 autotransporter outer membrane beta-barrel domain-containing protein [S
MPIALPLRHPLAAALAAALVLAPPARAQQVVADGDLQEPPAGEYHTTEPVLPGDPAGYVFYALNGGRIETTGGIVLRSAGAGAAAVRLEGSGTTIDLTKDTEIATSGDGAAGMSVQDRAQLRAENVRIDTQGVNSHGIEVDAASAGVSVGQITTRGQGAHGLVASAGGFINFLGGSVVAEGSNAYAVLASGAGSTVHLETANLISRAAGTYVALANTGASLRLQDAQVTHEGATGFGVAIHTGSTGDLRNVHIRMQGMGTGLAGGGDVVMLGGSVVADAAGSMAIVARGGSMQLESVDVRGDSGISANGGARLELVDSRVRSVNEALQISGMGTTAYIRESELLGDGGAATIAVHDSAVLELLRSVVRSEGDNRVGMDNRGGAVTLEDVQVHTTGVSSHALYAEASGLVRPRIDANETLLSTTGDSAIGAVARKGGSIHLADSAVLTTGDGAHGVLSGGVGEMALTNTHVRTEGEGAWAAVINDNGRMRIDGGSLVSARHGGVWLRSSRDPGLTLSNGALVSGSNGIGLALDAAVAGRFDLVLDGRSQLVGDIVITPEDEDAGLVPQSEVHVRLADGSLWQGSSDLVQTLAIEGGSQWTLTGDATVGGLQVLGSGLALSDGTGRFNTLTVDGDLHSENAIFLFQGALAGDDSAIDRLHVRGDSSGDASILVKNMGGVGAPTVDGIRLIEIDGASLASYTLAGRAVGGSYEYFLFKGGVADPSDGNWYLRSQWFDACKDNPAGPGCVVDPGPDPIDPTDPVDPVDPVDPILPPPVLRPEAGAYLANQSAAINLFAHRMHERSGTRSRGTERQAWARVGRQQADFSAVGSQLSVDGTTSVLQIGSDLLQRGNAAFGVMLGSGRADNRAVSRLTGYSATGRVRGNAVGVYGTWLQDTGGAQGAYVDAALQYGRFDNRVQGISLEPERYDSRMASASLETGYTFTVWQGPTSALYVQPQLQLSHVDFRADRHVERNGTVVDRADAGGLSGRVGVRVFGHGTAAGNTVQPYLGVNWLRGSGTSTLQFNGDTLGADVPRNRYEVQAGAELKLGQRWGAWGGVSVQRGDYGYRNVGGQLGLRMAW